MRAAAERGRGTGRGRRRRPPGLPSMRFNIASMIDVVFLLMIYFMLITEFRRPELAMAVDLPARLAPGAGAADPFALPERPIEVEVVSFGPGPAEYALRIDHERLGEAGTFASLREAAEGLLGAELGSDQRFTVRAGPDALWEHTLGAFNALRRAGYTRVRLAGPGVGE